MSKIHKIFKLSIPLMIITIINFFKKRSISFKIITGVFIFLAIAISIWGGILVISEKKILMEQIDIRGKTTTKAAGIFCSYPLLINDYVILQDYVEKVVNVENNIILARIKTNEGKVIADYQVKDLISFPKSDIKYYIASIKENPASNIILGQILLGISIEKSKQVIISRVVALLVLSFLLLIILAFVISFYLNRIIGRPINRLDKYAQILSDGNLDINIRLDSEDELGRLSATMNHMRHNLKISYEKIKKHNDELEEKVAERTASLTQANIRLEQSYRDLLESQKKIVYLAFHDDLTGLYNRKSCIERLNDLINIMKRSKQHIAVLYLGLDNFKVVNDKFGPTYGDHVIKAIADRIINCLRIGDEAARWNSDEFIVILPDVSNDVDAVLVAKKILTNINKPIIVDDKTIHLTTSIGISLYPQDGQDSETLISKSDSALNEAKKEGKNRYKLFDSEIYNKIIYQLEIADDLKYSLVEDDFLLYYQPKIDLQKNIVGLEALIRWNSKKHGFIPPNDFIPLAEASNVIIDIGKWVLKTACIENKQLQEAGFPPVRVSINISPKHFRHSHLVSDIKQTLETTGLASKWLEIEITETGTMENIEESIRIVKEINDLGIKIAIDDFGTGFSSFSKLTELSFDIIKIDKSFINQLNTNQYSNITIDSIIKLAHNLHKEVVAEGVETEDQFQTLAGFKCDQIQGYYFSKPLPFKELIALMKKVYS